VDSDGPKEPCAYWRNLANTVEPSMCCRDTDLLSNYFDHLLKCFSEYLSEEKLRLMHHHHRTTTVLCSFFRDHPGELVPEENFWTLWCKGRSTEAEIPTIRLDATPSAHLHHPHFLQAGCPSCRPTNSVKALKATNAFGLGRRR